MSLLGLLIALLVFCVVVWAARSLLAAFGIGDPVATVIYVVLVIIGLFILLGYTGIVPGHSSVYLR